MTHTCTAGNPAQGQPNPVLTKTNVIDTTPPTVALTGPVNGALVGVGAAVPAHFTCSDTTALATCVGTVANGANLVTLTPGVKTLAVVATDAAGNVAQKLVSIRVVQTTFTVHFQTSELPLLDAAAAYLNTDRAGFVKYSLSLLGYVESVRGPPDVKPTPPTNDGPAAVTAVYTPADGQLVTALAVLYGMSGDLAGRYAPIIVLYMYSVQHP